MEFLKDVLGEALYGQVETAVKAYNEKPENKDKQINIGNLASGEYVGKGKYDTLLAEKGNLETQVNTLNTTIGELKNNNKDNEELQNKIGDLEKELQQQQEENVKISKNYALKEQLSKAGVLDPDYIIYKQGGIDKFTFDKDNKPIGVDDVIKPYKEDTNMAHLFKQQEDRKPPYNPAGGGPGPTKNPFAKDSYNMTEQAKLFKSNPEQARALAAAAGVEI